MKALLTATVLLAAGASVSCSAANESTSYEDFCGAMERLHRATVAMQAEVGDHPTPFEAGRAHGRFVVENRADIDTVMNEAPPDLREETSLVYGNVLAMRDTPPEDVQAVLSADQEIADWVKSEC